MAKIALFISLITTGLAFILLLVGFLGSNPNASSLKHVYLLKVKADVGSGISKLASSAVDALKSGDTDKLKQELGNDAQNVNVDDLKNMAGSAGDNIDWDSVKDKLKSATGGSSKRKRDSGKSTDDLSLTVGASGYCINGDKCYGGPTPFYLDLADAAKNYVGGIKLPDEVQDYQDKIKMGGQAIWIVSVVALACEIGSIILGLITFMIMCCSRVAYIARLPAVFTVILSVIGVLASLISAGAATGVYAVVKSKLGDLTEKEDKIKVTPSLGTAGIALYWVAFFFAFISSILWGVGARASKRQIAYTTPSHFDGAGYHGYDAHQHPQPQPQPPAGYGHPGYQHQPQDDYYHTKYEGGGYYH